MVPRKLWRLNRNPETEVRIPGQGHCAAMTSTAYSGRKQLCRKVRTQTIIPRLLRRGSRRSAVILPRCTVRAAPESVQLRTGKRPENDRFFPGLCSQGEGFPRGQDDHPGICLKTVVRVSLTRARSPVGSAPSFRATHDFATVAGFSTRTTEGNFNPAPCQSETATSAAIRAGWLSVE